MHMLLIMAAKEINDSTPWWVPFLGLVGVVVGALIGGLVQFQAEKRRARNVRTEALWTARQEAEIKALLEVEGVVFSVGETLNSLSGSKGGPAADRASAAAIERLSAAERKMDIQAIIIRGIGNAKVAARLSAVKGRLRTYLHELLADGRFIADKSGVLMADLHPLMEAVIEAVREDLAQNPERPLKPATLFTRWAFRRRQR